LVEVVASLALKEPAVAAAKGEISPGQEMPIASG